MKKSKILILFLIFLFIPTSVFARSINIDKLESDIIIEKNGDYNINESFKFSGPENNNGVYRNIYYENSKGIADLKIFADGKELKSVNKAEKGDKYVYVTEDNGKELKIKCYIPWNKSIDVKYQYILKDAAIYGQDSGIFSYNFISKLDTNINSFTGTVRLKDYDFSKKVIIDPENTEYFVDNGVLTIKTSDLSSGSFISANAEIPLSLIPQSSNKKDISFSDIEKNRNISESDNFSGISPIAFVFEAVLLIISLFYMKKTNENFSKGETLGHIMPLSPAEASSFLFGNNNSSNFIYATILDWTNNGYFTISTENYKTKKNKEKVNYIFKRTNKNFYNISESESFLLNNILLKGNDSFSTKDLNSRRIHDSSKFNEQFTKYLGLLDKELRNKDLKPNSYKYIFIGLAFLLLSILFFIMSLVDFMYSTYIPVIGIILSVAMFIISLKIMDTQTALQKEQRDFYNKLYKSLKENDKIDNYSEEEKETLIIYSIAFGLKYERIKEIQEIFGIDTEIFIPIFWMTFIGGSSLTKEINRSFVGNENGVYFGGGTYSGFSGGTGSTGGGSAGGF